MTRTRVMNARCAAGRRGERRDLMVLARAFSDDRDASLCTTTPCARTTRRTAESLETHEARARNRSSSPSRPVRVCVYVPRRTRYVAAPRADSDVLMRETHKATRGYVQTIIVTYETRGVGERKSSPNERVTLFMAFVYCKTTSRGPVFS